MDFGIVEGMVALIAAVGSAGGAWGATRQRIKHVEDNVAAVRTDILSVEGDLAKHDEGTSKVAERLASIEAKLEFLVAVHTNRS